MRRCEQQPFRRAQFAFEKSCFIRYAHNTPVRLNRPGASHLEITRTDLQGRQRDDRIVLGKHRVTHCRVEHCRRKAPLHHVAGVAELPAHVEIDPAGTALRVCGSNLTAKEFQEGWRGPAHLFDGARVGHQSDSWGLEEFEIQCNKKELSD